MKSCTRCGRTTSAWDRDLISGLCAACRNDDAEKRRQEAAKHRQEFDWAEFRQEFDWAEYRQDPIKDAVDGRILIGVSVAIGFAGALCLFSDSEGVQVFGMAILGIAGMLYVAGVIRWAVSGSQFLQLDHLQRQHQQITDQLRMIAERGTAAKELDEISELLEFIVDQGRHADQLDLIRRLRRTGQLSDEEYQKERRDLLQDRN